MKRGDKIKTRFGSHTLKGGGFEYKRGVFIEQKGEYGFFKHDKTGKILKRKMADIELDEV